MEITDKRVADLIRAAGAGDPPAGSEARKIADYYAAYMDETRIEALGLGPIQPELQAIARVRTRRSLARALGETLRADVDILNNTNLHTERLFGLWVAQDLDDPTAYAPFLVQGGLGLPDRDYYLIPRRGWRISAPSIAPISPTSCGWRTFREAQAKADRIFDLEHKIALTHVSRADAEDVRKGDNHWTRDDFAAHAPGLDWDDLFCSGGPRRAARLRGLGAGRRGGHLGPGRP